MTDSREVIIDALSLAAERVTGDDLAAKARRRSHVQELKAALMAGGDAMPSRRELAAVLGDPGDPAVRHALDELAIAGGE